MATTTNYSWSTPDDTALVKDGAAAIRSLGTAIDTTVFTNAGAAIPKTLIDAKGDLIVGSAADTAARLAAGTNGYLLSANSGATNGLEWVAAPSSGSLTLLSTTTLSGTSTTISSISQAYTHLQVHIYDVKNDTANGDFTFKPNNESNLFAGISASANVFNGVNGGSQLSESNIKLNDSVQQIYRLQNNCWQINLYNYTEGTSLRQTFSFQGTMRNAANNLWYGAFAAGGLILTSGITSLVFSNSGGAFNQGTVKIYGVK